MNKLIIALGVLLLASPIMADNEHGHKHGHHNGHHNHNGTNGTNGLNGTDGLNGTNGTNGINGLSGMSGSNGVDGKDGTSGKDGKDGVNATVDDSAKLVLDTAIRLYDGKRFQWQVFNVYSLNRVADHDVIGDGRNMMFGARVIFKLGKSYEEQRIEEQDKKIQLLEKLLDH